jgi:hypothetical protein
MDKDRLSEFLNNYFAGNGFLISSSPGQGRPVWKEDCDTLAEYIIKEVSK